MLYTEFNLEDAKEVWQQEAREEGIEQMTSKIAASLLDILDEDTIAERLGLSLEEIESLKSQ